MLESDTRGVLPGIDINNRVSVHVTDENGKGVNNARISIIPAGAETPSIETSTNTEGYFYFFPRLEASSSITEFRLRLRPPEAEMPLREATLDLSAGDGEQNIEVVLEAYTSMPPDSLDIAFVIDTTGSMADELGYLTSEFGNIISIIKTKYPGISMSFGLVVYRDVGDLYVVRHFNFSDSISEMQSQLANQSASGGGDYPEAMDQAISAALGLQWRGGDTPKLLFLVADAPPHDENLLATLAASQAARNRGINIFSLAGSGVGLHAEFLMRAMSLITHGRYLFLTDDSMVGNSHTAPPLACYLVTHLDQLIIRIISTALEGRRIEPEESQIIRKVGSYVQGVCNEDEN